MCSRALETTPHTTQACLHMSRTTHTYYTDEDEGQDVGDGSKRYSTVTHEAISRTNRQALHKFSNVIAIVFLLGKVTVEKTFEK